MLIFDLSVHPVALSTNDKLEIGAFNGNEFFDGGIALPFVANRAYSTTQILGIYNSMDGWFRENTGGEMKTNGNDIDDLKCIEDKEVCYALANNNVVKIDVIHYSNFEF